jgi:hypothetical protein
MRITWIGGWGVAPESLRPMANVYFPGSEHTMLAPTADVIDSAVFGLRGQAQRDPAFDAKAPSPLRSAGAVHGASADLTIAWSLGAWRVLEAASRGAQFGGMVLLLAPFVAFPSESKLGGKSSVTQVKFLRRWLEREPLAALADFYQRAGLTGGSAGLQPAFGERTSKANHRPALQPPSELPYALPDLLEGLDRLAEDASPELREFAARGLPRNWQALVGDADPLLDGDAVCRALRGCTLVRGVGHAIVDLLQARLGAESSVNHETHEMTRKWETTNWRHAVGMRRRRVAACRPPFCDSFRVFRVFRG